MNIETTNEMKAKCIGEFSEQIELCCHEDYCEGDDCECCEGTGTYMQKYLFNGQL